jgi:hypothetical protein
MSETTDLPTLWRNQAPEPALSVPRLREKAGSLHWEANRLAISGYFWAAFFLATFGWNALHARNAVERAGAVICMFGAIFLAYQWRRFGTKNLPHDLPVLQFLKAYRDELLRQKRLLHGPIILSVLPLVLGNAIAGVGHLAARPPLHAATLAPLAFITALILAVAWVLGRLQSQQLQFRIDEVEAALREAA